MALSGVVSKGLVGGSVGTPFGRSISCGDLSSSASSVANREGIQLFLNAPGSSTPSRVLAADSISSVNLKVKAPFGGFSSKQQCIFPGSHATDDVLSASADSMRFELGLSDLMFLSVSTASGKEYAFSNEKRSRAPSRLHAECIQEEEYSDDDTYHGGELVPVFSSSCLPTKQSLHVVADRKMSKVFLRNESQGQFLELSVQSSPAISRSNSWNSEIEVPRSPLLNDAAFVQEKSFAADSALLAQVEDGLTNGFTPELTEDGTGGTYFMADGDGHKVAVFKPADEEPLALNNPRGLVPSTNGEGLKKGTRVGEGAFREVAAYLLDHPSTFSGSDSEDNEGFSGVPRTLLARCSPEFFSKHSTEDYDDIFLSGADTSKLGSLQQFVPALSNCEDMGPQRFPAHEVHKIAVLDMRLGNTDRNGANILVQQKQQQQDGGLILTPIDHGYCLPESLEECTFEWLFWPQARQPFDLETLQYIASLDAEEDLETLRRCGWEVSEAVARTLRACTMLLKKGAEKGMTAFEIGSLMVRQDLDVPSVLEGMVEEAEAWVDKKNLMGADAFVAVLDCVMEDKLTAEN